MAVQVWKDMSLLIGSLSFETRAKDVNLATEVAALDITALSTTGNVELVGGLKSGTVSMTIMTDDGFFVDNGLHNWLSNVGNPLPTTIATGSDDGAVAYLFNQIPLNYTPWGGSVGEVATGSISGASSTSPVVRGRTLHAYSKTGRTASGSGTGQQLGAVAAGKSIYGALHVTYVEGTSPTLDVKIQSDDNASFTSPTDRITFTQAVTGTSEWKSTPGAITDTYWRCVWTIGGTSPLFFFQVTAGIL